VSELVYDSGEVGVNQRRLWSEQEEVINASAVRML